MHYCGNRELAQLLANLGCSAEFQADSAPAFSLPGDQPRYAPDRPADVRHVDIAVTLDFEHKSLHGIVTTDFTTLFERISEITFDAGELDIASVSLVSSDAALDFWTQGEKLHIRLDREYTHGEDFTVRVNYSATPRIGLTFVSSTDGDPDLPLQAWSQGETEYHHFWFPCHDFPNDRATTALHATVPGAFFVLSNGQLEEIKKHRNGTKTYHWRMDVAYPAYLVTLVAGEFIEIQDNWRDIPVNYYVRPGREDDGLRMLGKTPRMIEYFSTHFGVDYPYVKYGQIVPELFLGAMENASATTHSYRLLGDQRAALDFSSEDVVAHELVHQWHGDLLAVRDWSHTWLKEGFATYFEATWTEEDLGVDERQVMMRDYLHAYLGADKQGRRPIVYNVYRKNADELFDRHVYQKAAHALHTMRYVLGDEPFWRGIQLYTRRNAGREVITADLERAMEEATGRSMARFFEQWYYKSGHPEFKVSYSWDDEHKTARVSIAQTQEIDDETPLFVTPVDIAFLVPDADGAQASDHDVAFTMRTVRVTLEEESQTFYFPLPRRPFSVRFDQGGWLLKTLDFERPADMLRFQLRHDPDVLGRIEAAEALGKLADRRSFTTLAQALLDEPFWAVRGAIAGALASQKSERALDALLRGLDHIAEPKARRAIVEALGAFRAPEQFDLAERAAQTLTRIVTAGDPSYFVEAAAATALGRTRTAGAYETLLAKVDTPSWRETIRAGVFAGLGELGDPRVVEVLARWTTDRTKPMDARAAAAAGLRELAMTRRIDPGEAQTRAVEALIAALDDPWEMAVYAAASALAAWGDQRAIPALERMAASALDQRGVRIAREAARRLRKGRSAGEESRKLRHGLEEVRDENRKLRERLEVLESRLAPETNGKGMAATRARRNVRAKVPATSEAMARQ
ncbi:MAG: hypothetical protein OJF49_000241 [Ktedonobacterales bacterium]|jgi:aminopeptidase N|nr:MAG: hypothetical protein OJF49_000241 [Ktedonobacterales bacterium]